MDVERAIRKAVEVLTPVGVVVWVPTDPAQGLAGSVLAGAADHTPGVISAMSAGISRGHQRGRIVVLADLRAGASGGRIACHSARPLASGCRHVLHGNAPIRKEPLLHK